MSEYFDFLRRVYFFRNLSSEELELIAEKCNKESFAPGDIIFAENSQADKFYIVIDGKVEVWKNYYDPRPDLLAVHGAGHLFGEMALIDDLPRSATLVAREPTQVLFLYRSDFHNLIKSHTSIALSVMMSVSLMVRSSNEIFVEDLRKRNLELEKANENLRRAQAELLRAERLSTLGKFSSLILHDIRNPISVLQGQAQLMLFHLGDKEKLEMEIRNLIHETGRLERLSSELLDYSRGDIRLDIGVHTVADIFSRIIGTIGERFRKEGIAISLKNEVPGPILLDGERIFRVFLNLADNARKAMSGRGGTFTLGAKAETEKVVFSVSDTGEGMSEEVLEHVFEPFFSSSSRGGTGLGSLIVKNIVEAHGGKVRIFSKPGEGTTVAFDLPLRN
jgi:signal transduction histidine kinase